ncbi:CsbD family protein [Leptolyngbya sp. CCY15150]|uniref:CsbD family protein n=1 Tax=Leptolyngbya sp. CCY15150 TaxID=2767772 RepID=UPI00195135B5|nr:CsbD family protein [Leptolyngbya sp. CCY15150]
MGLQDKAKATAKNIEGKIQEAAGALTDNPKTQAKGKAKQAEAKLRHQIEKLKDAVQNR